MNTTSAGPDLTAARWYAVGGSRGLEPGSTRAVSLFGRDIVLWRGASGRLHAWDNRCPHRGLRLSLGTVWGDRLVCAYHGWRYGEDGACEFVPAHPDFTPSTKARVPVFAAHDDGALLWLHLGDGRETAPALGAVAFCRSLALDLSAEALLSKLSGLVFLPAALEDESAIARPWRYRRHEAAGPGQRLFWQREGDEARSVSYRSEVLGPGLLAVTAQGDGLATETRVLALQPADDSACLLHVAVRRDDGEAQSIRPAVARWAARLRWFLEADGCEAQSYSPLTGESDAS